uniref:tRNA(Ile)-lysidine synthase, chloroplastic n=1 Tax=Nephroselmis olivacea TaxID=31312 RepID=TILS_NEPOL|nr:hypothetical chloroplast RF62 [Nephroselmis olivacea]NP_050959.1 hypothetical chloroplast RF62 [Nephroselmis olivacea]Q9T390.1 RecName: Full=tRNA(Ile)-lysidine synthase, chloroplastic; AltName: Full=tRNA(Ile)-2-lysyl-cytidine synthase; AltName: Full=tRNA(Ile)-lysidine synthetase [Nephroselmis olivacea]AAD54859.1 hypothetical chloroplast RF62 [Nephroselmis olivacea]AAD54930.1 hypothetical chloroplast RF62 [Nephroselmis olivacea]
MKGGRVQVITKNNSIAKHQLGEYAVHIYVLLYYLSMREILREFEEACLLQGLVSPSTRLLISCSGGQDSVTLLFLLCQLQTNWTWRLGVVYCNHMWRYGSIETPAKLARICLLFGVSCSFSVSGSRLQKEEEGRSWRLRVLCRMSSIHSWFYISTGHTASDRIETLLSNVLRGSSSSGMRSINWYTSLDTQVGHRRISIPIIRPLLGISRLELRNYANRWKLPLCYDPSNQDQRIRRNRIRHELLPYLRHWWNPQIDRLLAQTAEVTSWESSYYDLICTQICQQYEWIGDGGVRFPWRIFHSIPTSLHSRILWIFLNRALVFLNPAHGFQGNFDILQFLLETKTCHCRHGSIYISKDVDWLRMTLVK